MSSKLKIYQCLDLEESEMVYHMFFEAYLDHLSIDLYDVNNYIVIITVAKWVTHSSRNTEDVGSF